MQRIPLLQRKKLRLLPRKATELLGNGASVFQLKL